MKIDLTDEMREQIIETASERIAHELRESFRYRADQLKAEIVDETVRAAFAEITRAEILKIFEEGWQRTNRYGEPEGKERVTLRMRIADLFTKSLDSYDRESMLVKIGKEEAQKAIREALEPEAKKAAAEFRQKADELLSGRFQQVLRESLGLK